jgi:hypothetical protein
VIGKRHLLAALCCTLLALPAAAGASSTQEAVFMDDNELVFGTDQEVEATFVLLRSLGVDRVRVSLLWHMVAPSPDSASRPSFGAGGPTDPAAYPTAGWNIYDRVVNAATRNGIGLYFTITGPAPVWASSDPSRNDKVWDPKPADFGDFVTAVGRRYSGSYIDEAPVQAPAPGGLPIIGRSPPPPGPPLAVLPRVSMWSLYNEPNQPGWLRPQSSGQLLLSPRLYRALQDAGYAALRASGHADDTYLLAETAPRGALTVDERSPMRPLLFIRELYCLDRKLRPYSGDAATVRGCPPDAAGQQSFSADHPGLFKATGFAHHPYALEVAPSVPDRYPDQVTLAVLPRLTKALDGIFSRYGMRRKIPVWLTEYGYQTDPPDDIIGVSWKRQAAWLNEAEYMAFRYRRVRSMAQFLLVDDGPNTSWPQGDPRYWGSTFQSGLISLEGTRKDSFHAYQMPIHVSPRRVRRGRKVSVFGGNRPARNGAALPVAVEFRRRGSSEWKVVRRLTTRSRRGYVLVKLRQRAAGAYRLAWESGRSRSVSVSVTG